MNNFSERYILNPAVAMQEVQGQIMFLVPDEYDVLTLNASGAFVWRALHAGGTPLEAAALVAARYHISRAQAERDVAELLRQLLAKGVLIKAADANTDGA
jgi:hypothetical protein